MRKMARISINYVERLVTLVLLSPIFVILFMTAAFFATYNWIVDEKEGSWKYHCSMIFK